MLIPFVQIFSIKMISYQNPINLESRQLLCFGRASSSDGTCVNQTSTSRHHIGKSVPLSRWPASKHPALTTDSRVILWYTPLQRVARKGGGTRAHICGRIGGHIGTKRILHSLRLERLALMSLVVAHAIFAVFLVY